MNDQVKKYFLLLQLSSLFVYLGLYIAFIDKITPDYTIWLEPWYNTILQGGFRSLRHDFYNYSPPYMYLIALATTIQAIPIISIKLLSLPIIPLAGYYISRLAYLINPQPIVIWVGFSITLFVPTILINSAYWGQADIFYGTACLACVIHLLHKQPLAAMLAFGVAIAFKAQAVLLTPFLCVMLIKRQIPWKFVIIPPAILVLSVLPVVIIGKPIQDVVLIYLRQADTYHSLCMNCTNLWSIFPTVDYRTGVVIGFLAALTAAIGYVVLMVMHLSVHDPRQIFSAAMISVMVIPFFLPKMHDRYFYVAELLSVGIILIDWRELFIPLLLQVSTGNVYWQYLLRRGFLYPQFESGIINIVVIGLLLQLFMKQKRLKLIGENLPPQNALSDSSN